MNKQLIFKTFIFFVAGISLSSCEGLFSEDIENPEITYFVEKVNLTGLKEYNEVNDTIWLEYELPETLIDYQTSNVIALENATGFLKGTFNMLYRFDTTDFSSQNFKIIVENGEINLIQVINSNYITYYFDIKYGKPLSDNKVKVGLVGLYSAVYALELKSVIYYGPNRTDYSDYSVSHNQGEITHAFNVNDINSQLFYALPVSTQQYYSTYYTTYAIQNKWFCFIEFSTR